METAADDNSYKGQ